MAVAVVFLLATQLGASGTMRLKNVLVSPQTMKEFSFSDLDPKDASGATYVFNKIEFVRAEVAGKRWGRYAVSVPSYEVFYKKVANLRSLIHPADELISPFDVISSSTLTLFMQKREEGKKEEEIFQRVEFVDKGDIFRVELFDKGREEWLYFQSPGIYNEVVALFAPTAP